MHPTTRRTLLRAAGALLTLSSAPAAVLAQQTLDPVHVTATPTQQADALHEQALALPTETRFAKRAARMHERSAALRAEGDTKTAECLRTAGYLRYYSGDRRAGANLLAQAAERSAETGDVVRAANAFIDAAIIAGELSDTRRAIDLRTRAELLATSPLISDADRTALRARFAQWRDVAVK